MFGYPLPSDGKPYEPTEATQWAHGGEYRPPKRVFESSDDLKRDPDAAPDTHSQLDELLGAVWAGEANWRFDDFLDLADRADKGT